MLSPVFSKVSKFRFGMIPRFLSMYDFWTRTRTGTTRDPTRKNSERSQDLK